LNLQILKKGNLKDKKESDKPRKVLPNPLSRLLEKPAKDAEQKPQVKKEEEEKEVEDPLHKTQYTKLSGPNFTGEKIDLNQFKKTPTKKEKEKEKEKEAASKRRKRKRISKTNTSPGASKPNFKKGAKPAPRRNVKAAPKEDPTPEEVQKQVRETLEKLQGRSAGKKGAKYRRDKKRST